VSLTVPKADFMKLFSLTDLTASYNMSDWDLERRCTAQHGSVPAGRPSRGSMTYSGNILKAGSLSVGKISLAGLLGPLPPSASTLLVGPGVDRKCHHHHSPPWPHGVGTVSLSVANGVLAKGSPSR